MYVTESGEARVSDARNVLVASCSALRDEDLRREFFGSVVSPEELGAGSVDLELTGKNVYLCGDIPSAGRRRLRSAGRVFRVRERSDGLHEDEDEDAPWPLVGVGRLPLRVHGVGVYYPRFFEPGERYFERIGAEHAFQSLTESTKPGTAHRSGIYLTPVTRSGDALHFRLLRCSTNLSGPTENFGPTDREIVDALNREADAVFRDHAPLNHVLAQIYHNTRATAERKQSKARIASHADKTKDMPVNGIMAFCTFYDRNELDYGSNGTSQFTRLRFRLKESAAEREEAALPRQFELTLHPGSVFFMPLSTNRRYTHEIRPSPLDAASIPTRLGYVVRCASAEAVHENGRTFLKRAEGAVELEPPTEEGMAELRRLYAEENRSSSFVDYGDGFVFSMNAGDYLAPRH